jgi:hypothetical protein
METRGQIPSLFVLQAKSKQSPQIMNRAVSMYFGKIEPEDSDFVKAFKEISLMLINSQNILNLRLLCSKNCKNLKATEDVLSQHIDHLARGIEIMQSNRENRKTFLMFKMYVPIVKIFNIYIEPRKERPLLHSHSVSSNKVVVSILGLLENLVKVEEDSQFPVEVAHYDPLLISLFWSLDKYEIHFK